MFTHNIEPRGHFGPWSAMCSGRQERSFFGDHTAYQVLACVAGGFCLFARVGNGGKAAELSGEAAKNLPSLRDSSLVFARLGRGRQHKFKRT